MSKSDDGIKGQIEEAERIAFENSAPLMGRAQGQCSLMQVGR